MRSSRIVQSPPKDFMWRSSRKFHSVGSLGFSSTRMPLAVHNRLNRASSVPSLRFSRSMTRDWQIQYRSRLVILEVAVGVQTVDVGAEMSFDGGGQQKEHRDHSVHRSSPISTATA